MNKKYALKGVKPWGRAHAWVSLQMRPWTMIERKTYQRAEAGPWREMHPEFLPHHQGRGLYSAHWAGFHIVRKWWPLFLSCFEWELFCWFCPAPTPVYLACGVRDCLLMLWLLGGWGRVSSTLDGETVHDLERLDFGVFLWERGRVCYVYGKIFGGWREVLWKRQLEAFHRSVLYFREGDMTGRSCLAQTIFQLPCNKVEHLPIKCE